MQSFDSLRPPIFFITSVFTGILERIFIFKERIHVETFTQNLVLGIASFIANSCLNLIRHAGIEELAVLGGDFLTFLIRKYIHTYIHKKRHRRIPIILDIFNQSFQIWWLFLCDRVSHSSPKDSPYDLSLLCSNGLFPGQ